MTVTEEVAPSIMVPRGRSAAERRLSALGALHQPIVMRRSGHGIVPDETFYVCGECKQSDRYGDLNKAPWPCTTARLLGPWPGEMPDA